MAVKVSKYVPTSSINTSTPVVTSSDSNTSEESFQDVLVLNQTALRAMAIDAMIAESSSGSVTPDAVNAAAVMKFRSTLASNIVAPIPTDDWDGGTPQKASTSGTISSAINNIANTISSTILECSEELNSYFQQAAALYGVDEKLLKSIACAESNFNPSATSQAGAMGIMQMMPATAAECGVDDPYDAQQSIMGGAQYISKLLNKYNGNTTLALAAYNAGSGNVDKYNGIPPFEETQNYVQKVLSYYNS